MFSEKDEPHIITCRLYLLKYVLWFRPESSLVPVISGYADVGLGLHHDSRSTIALKSWAGHLMECKSRSVINMQYTVCLILHPCEFFPQLTFFFDELCLLSNPQVVTKLTCTWLLRMFVTCRKNQKIPQNDIKSGMGAKAALPLKMLNIVIFGAKKQHSHG